MICILVWVGVGATATQLPFWCSSGVAVVHYNTGLLTGIDNLRNNNILVSETPHALTYKVLKAVAMATVFWECECDPYCLVAKHRQFGHWNVGVYLPDRMMLLRFGGTCCLHLQWTVEAADSTKRLVRIYQSPRRCIPADRNHTHFRYVSRYGRWCM
jgi:hypothetical protein